MKRLHLTAPCVVGVMVCASLVLPLRFAALGHGMAAAPDAIGARSTFDVRHPATAGSRHVVTAASNPFCTRRPFSPCRADAGEDVINILVGPAQLPRSATGAVVRAKCPGKGLGAVCGYVKVPLDRRQPHGAQIPIFFELFTHTNSGPAVSAILVNFGGPGSGTTDPGDTSFALSLFAKNLDAHDLLLIDDRGRGFSGTIACKPLQHGTEPFGDAVADCASQLDKAVTRYGTGDIAKDTEAVRAALGYGAVDYFGASYGGEDVSGYATRFGRHLRSIVLDAPYGTPVLDQLAETRNQTRADPRMIRLVCAYSPTCRADHPDPLAEFDWLVRSIRNHPIAGYAYDASGNLVSVKLDEAALLAYTVANPTGNFVSTGELVAAARSLRYGDPGPLLRLGAEGFSPKAIDYGNPTAFSAGAALASICVDADWAWRWSARPQERMTQYANAVAGLPADYFAPFSKSAATGPLYFPGPTECLRWEKPRPSSPITPLHARYPSLPTLVLSGDIDNQVPLEEVSQVAPLFPNSTLVTVAEAGHTTVNWSHCAAYLASQFIESTHVGNLGCTKIPETVFPAVARFPLLAKDAIPAAVDSGGHNQVKVTERKAVTVAVAAAVDSLQRSTIGSGSDHCLRAGAFQTQYFSNKWRSTLVNCSFANDVTVNGTVTWRPNSAFVADLVLSGTGTAGGTIHVVGTWQAPGPVGNFKVSGNLGGLTVAVLVPEA